MLKKIILNVFPHAATFWSNLKVMIRSRSLIPTYVNLPYSATRLYTNWHEPRGRAILSGNAMGQPNVKSFWRSAIKEFKPQIIVDCGLNYGEILFWCTYPNAEHVFGIEADQTLFPFLHKSLQTHPDKEKIILFSALVGDTVDQVHDFFIDPSWSGRSSALISEKMPKSILKKEMVKTITLDHILKDTVHNRKLLFKIDVEGFEPFVLNGMEMSFTESDDYLGILEFNPKFIQKTTGDVLAYLNSLKRRHDLYWLRKTVSLNTTYTLKELALPVQEELFDGDLILVKKGNILFKE